MENPPPTFFVNSRKFFDIDTLCVKSLRKIDHFKICFLSGIDRFLIRTHVKYPETLKDNNFKIPRSIFFKFGPVL
jgi:hypothetical protein